MRSAWHLGRLPPCLWGTVQTASLQRCAVLLDRTDATDGPQSNRGMEPAYAGGAEERKVTTRVLANEPGVRMLHVTVDAELIIECILCGSATDLRCIPLMTGDDFKGPTRYPVCTACGRKWIGNELNLDGAIVEVRT